MVPDAHSHQSHEFDWDAMAASAELEAEVLMPFLDEAASVLAGVARGDGLDIGHILDIGSGPGVATCRLAEQFGEARVLAADGSAEMLARVVARAERHGLADRVQTRLIDLPDGIEDLGSGDLVWASMVLHHVGDEAGALRALRARLHAGGLLALVEFGDPLRVLPDDADLGGAETWQRLDAARAVWMGEMRAGLPGAVASDGYPEMLAAAGFDVLIDRTVPVRLDAPLDRRGRELALHHLTRMREHVDPYADAADLAVLDRLVAESDPAGIVNRPDALLHVSRHLFVARAT